MIDFLFVYGTLMRTAGHAAHRLLEQHAQYAGEGYFVGRLYRAADYPIAVASSNPGDKVFGELYRIGNAQALFAARDEYEGDGFVLCQVSSICNEVASGAWVYLAAEAPAQLQPIASGRFVD